MSDRVYAKVQAQQKTLVGASSASSKSSLLRRTCACGQHTIAGSECEACQKTREGIMQRAAVSAAPVNAVPPIVHDVLSSPGHPLDASTRTFMEPRFGHDFSQVRVHTDAQAAESAKAVNALAYAVGRDVVFGQGQYAPGTSAGQRLLAHELTHVMQQNGRLEKPELKLDTIGNAAEKEADQIAAKITRQRDGVEAPGIQQAHLSPRVQRYEAGEHAQFGETGDVLKTFITERAFTYRVKSGETLEKIATKFGVPVKDLKEANSASLKKWRTTRRSGNIVEGFNAGEEITIPPIVNEFTQKALKSKELIFTVNGVNLEYGVGISMGDFYENAAQMVNAPAAELQALAALIRKEKSGTPVSTKEWDDATNGRYHLLAEKNESHFAPSNPKLVDVSSVPHGSDHKTEWEKYHKMALDKSQAGSKDEALQVNAFGDHFLTDAFAAGHLINKRDVMEKFKGNLTKDTAGDFIGDAKTFFDNVARNAFVGSVKTEFSKYETVQWRGGIFRPNIDSESRFSSLLQGIQTKEPDVLANAVAKAVHDDLNRQPKGISVENAKGEKWELSGDGTLNAKSKEIGRKAVAQSQLNISDAFKMIRPLDYPSKYKKVWDYVPFPTESGETDIKAKVTSGTNPKDTSLISTVVTLIKTNYLLIIDELVKRKILKKA